MRAINFYLNPESTPIPSLQMSLCTLPITAEYLIPLSINLFMLSPSALLKGYQDRVAFAMRALIGMLDGSFPIFEPSMSNSNLVCGLNKRQYVEPP